MSIICSSDIIHLELVRFLGDLAATYFVRNIFMDGGSGLDQGTSLYIISNGGSYFIRTSGRNMIISSKW